MYVTFDIFSSAATAYVAFKDGWTHTLFDIESNNITTSAYGAQPCSNVEDVRVVIIAVRMSVEDVNVWM